MRTVLALALTGFLAPAAWGATADDHARAALALALALRHPPGAPAKGGSCGCEVIGFCTCGDSCTCTACRNRRAGPPAREAALLYGLAYRRALQEGRPLLVWVGLACPSCEDAMQEYIHYHCSRFDGDPAPRVIVSRPQAGELVQVVTFAGLPTAEEIRAALARTVGLIGWPQPFPPAPAFAGRLGVCRERVRQLVAKAVGRARLHVPLRGPDE